MPNRFTAPLTQWDYVKGFGFLKLERESIFLHKNDCMPGFKIPASGDMIQFSLGHDASGRVCAKNAFPVELDATGQSTPIRAKPTAAKPKHFPQRAHPFSLNRVFLLLLLLVAPFLAFHKLALPLDIVGISALGISVVTYLLYALDKVSAVSGQWRTPETTLHLFSLIGGWPGAFVAQQRLRHKTAKLSFQITFWLIVLAWQYVTLDYFLDWKMTNSVLQLRHAFQPQV